MHEEGINYTMSSLLLLCKVYSIWGEYAPSPPPSPPSSFLPSRMHVVLDVSPSALHQLRLLRVYPIVIRIKFKSPKQVKLPYSLPP